MNENPWRVDDIARLERERVQDEMRAIRAAEAANRQRPARPNVLALAVARLYVDIRKWLRLAGKAAGGLKAQPQLRVHAKPHARA